MTAPGPDTVDQTSRLIEETELAQSRAAMPEASAWVSANAGAGKTHVLKLRVLRLLLAGVPADQILCLTFTKTAAAEMSERVFKALAEWTILDDDSLANALTALTGKTPTADALVDARCLFARAIETPGGLKVQTIHAFCEQLLQRFPLEAGLPPGLRTIDEPVAKRLVADALDAVLADANHARDGANPLATALSRMIAFAADERFTELIREPVDETEADWLADMALLRERLQMADGPDAIAAYYRSLFGLAPDATVAGLTQEIADLLDDGMLRYAAQVLAGSKGAGDQKLAKAFSAAAATTTADDRADLLIAAFLTKDLKPKSDKGSFITKAVREEDPGLTETLCEARDCCADLVAKRNLLEAISSTTALLDLALAVRDRFSALKTQHGALDFDDLIARTVGLLEGSNAADWVLYKLDGGVSHILVDEAQDTSPRQWDIVHRLAEPFFAGDDGREAQRTVFAVGDEKQSIYSFQGARPDLFATSGAMVENKASATAQPFHRVPLTLSFRTVAPVLQAVDAVFADPERTPGLAGNADGVQHRVLRAGEAGRVELWPLEQDEAADPGAPFDPLAEQPSRSSVQRLSERIATTIAAWLEDGRRLEALDRPIRAGDIMILVRKRHPFAAPIIAALKQRGIPVAGADRMVITEQLGVQDLMALADFLTLPEDDLALANVLKSPLFDYNDDDLIALAPGRAGSLWSTLIRAAETGTRHARTAQLLKRWRGRADYMPPFEFFAELLAAASHLDDAASYRGRMLRRLGPDAGDPLDEFLECALRYDDEGAPSLQGFITWLRETEPAIKRDMDTKRDEVRLMTVHGAKGLEAPVVILPDTTAAPTATQSSGLLNLKPRGGAQPAANDVQAIPVETVLWTSPLAGATHPLIDRAKAARRDSQIAESNRLLYVAMTRARDELYIAGAEPKRRQPDKPAQLDGSCWYALIDEALQPLARPAVSTAGHDCLVLAGEQTAPIRPPDAKAAPSAMASPLPAWAGVPVPSEPRRQIPVVPSRLAPLETDDFGDPIEARSDAATDAADRPPEMQATSREPAAPPPTALAGEARFLRGTTTHALLQYLPEMDPSTWDAAAERFVAVRAALLTPRQRASIVSETLAVLRAPDFAAAFGPDSRAEVSIVAEIADPTAKGPPLKITGQIDRLVVTDHNVLIIDFKTNRPPPQDVATVPSAYILQLAAYRLAISSIYPTRAVAAALLWTDGARLMPIPSAILDDATAALWTGDGPSLDALAGQT